MAAVLLTNLFTGFPDRDGDTRAATRGTQASTRSLGPRSVVVTVPAPAASTPAPPSFLGLSTEYWSLPVYVHHMAAFGRVLSSLRVPGEEPLILRVGGDSADRTIWAPRLRPMPSWVFALTPAWLQAARAVLHRVSARLILDLNLITGSPSAAALWAQAAQADLPKQSIIGFEVGNEPDIYSRLFWITALSRRALDVSILPRDLTPLGYVRDFRAYARLLKRLAPRVPLLGPAIANPTHHLAWVSTLVAHARPDLGIVTAHRYAYTACAAPWSPNYPTIERLLGDHASAGIARALGPLVAVAHRAGLPFRLTELNSVTCGGVPGVSNTFATALWAPDALFELMRAGVDGVNVHVRTGRINAAFAFNRHGLVARPLLYGLILFRRALGPDARLVHVQVSARRSAHVKVWAVELAGGRLHVLVIDKGSRPVTVALHLPQTGPATVQRLLAPSVTARSGVTLGGQSLSNLGRWIGVRTAISIVPRSSGYQLTVPRYSAALVSVGGTLASPSHDRARPQRVARPDSVRLGGRYRAARGHARARRGAAAMGA